MRVELNANCIVFIISCCCSRSQLIYDCSFGPQLEAGGQDLVSLLHVLDPVNNNEYTMSDQTFKIKRADKKVTPLLIRRCSSLVSGQQKLPVVSYRGGWTGHAVDVPSEDHSSKSQE